MASSDTSSVVIALAKGQVGYHEGRSGGDWNNVQKFSRQVPGLAWSNGYAWCATFVSWALYKAGAGAKLSYTASVANYTAQFKRLGRFSEYPALGAVALYGSTGGAHTGIVYGWDADYVYAVEGNTNTNGSSEGDGVYLKRRIRRSSYVYGYGIPFYAERIQSADPKWNGKWGGVGAEPKPVISPTKHTRPAPAKKPAVKKATISLAAVQKAARLDKARPQGGTTSGAKASVRAVESLLLAAKLLDKRWVDGSYGSLTLAAYARWQKHLGYRGRDADGIPGSVSLRALIAKYGSTKYTLGK